MKIAVIGWYGKRNAGDDSFQTAFRQELPGHELFFCQQVGDLPSPPDAVIFGGGGVVSPGRYFSNLTKEQPLYALGVDLATSGKDYENWTKYNFQEIWTRSELYTCDLQAAGHLQVKYCPDLVFAITPPAPRDNDPKVKRLIVCMTDELKKVPGALAIVQADLARMSEDWEIHFVSFYCGTKNPDWEIHRELAAGLPEGARVVHREDYGTPEDVMQYMSEGDLVLSMRFHGIIFSTLMGIPFVAFSATGKNSLFCEQEALKEQFIDIAQVQPMTLFDALRRSYRSRNYLSLWLKRVASKNREIVKKVFHHFMDEVLK